MPTSSKDLIILADRNTYIASTILTQCGERESINETKSREVLEYLRRATAAMQELVGRFEREEVGNEPKTS